MNPSYAGFLLCPLGFFLVNLVYEDGATQASSPRLTWALKGAVLGDEHHVGSHATITCLFCRQAKVETIAGVIFHNEKDSRSSCLGRKAIW